MSHTPLGSTREFNSAARISPKWRLYLQVPLIGLFTLKNNAANLPNRFRDKSNTLELIDQHSKEGANTPISKVNGKACQARLNKHFIFKEIYIYLFQVFPFQIHLFKYALDYIYKSNTSFITLLCLHF